MGIIKSTIIATTLGITVGCASVTPPPDRIYWNEAEASTQCTDDANAVSGQYAGSLLLSGIGGWDIGATLASGGFPIIGIGLAAWGIGGAADTGTKIQQIKDCKEFKQYVMLRDTKNKVDNISTKERLDRLKMLLAEKTISEPEYQTARSKILNSM